MATDNHRTPTIRERTEHDRTVRRSIAGDAAHADAEHDAADARVDELIRAAAARRRASTCCAWHSQAACDRPQGCNCSCPHCPAHLS